MSKVCHHVALVAAMTTKRSVKKIVLSNANLELMPSLLHAVSDYYKQVELFLLPFLLFKDLVCTSCRDISKVNTVKVVLYLQQYMMSMMTTLTTRRKEMKKHVVLTKMESYMMKECVVVVSSYLVAILLCPAKAIVDA